MISNFLHQTLLCAHTHACVRARRCKVIFWSSTTIVAYLHFNLSSLNVFFQFFWFIFSIGCCCRWWSGFWSFCWLVLSVWQFLAISWTLQNVYIFSYLGKTKRNRTLWRFLFVKKILLDNKKSCLKCADWKVCNCPLDWNARLSIFWAVNRTMSGFIEFLVHLI